jgi:hypothetical protein
MSAEDRRSCCFDETSTRDMHAATGNNRANDKREELTLALRLSHYCPLRESAPERRGLEHDQGSTVSEEERHERAG